MKRRAPQPMETAPRDGTSVRVPAQGGYTHAFYQDGAWWWHSHHQENYACGPEPDGWYPPDTEPVDNLSGGPA